MLLRRRRAIALAAAILVLLLPACTGKKKKEKAAPPPTAVTSSAAPVPSPSPSPTPTPTPSPSATPTPTASPSSKPVPAKPRVAAPTGHPLTGGREPIGPVVAVKVDNDPTGFPQSGLDGADVIYQELIESGETRLCAIYSTKRPSLVGPIRSARETDIELLAQYGKIALSFSGANKIILGVVRRANLVDARWDAVPSAYRELTSKRRPHRVHVSISKLMDRAPGAVAKDVGLRFGASTSPSSPARTVTMRWTGGTSVVRYDASTRRYTVSFNGHRQVTVDNLVVQYAKVQKTGFTDAAGNYTPLTRTLGSNKLTVFRDGRSIDGSWHRQFMKDPTTMLDSVRHRLLLRPGTTFVMLVPSTQRVSVS